MPRTFGPHRPHLGQDGALVLFVVSLVLAVLLTVWVGSSVHASAEVIPTIDSMTARLLLESTP
jgi:hypothetical protein